jgi:hypothetical protein
LSSLSGFTVVQLIWFYSCPAYPGIQLSSCTLVLYRVVRILRLSSYPIVQLSCCPIVGSSCLVTQLTGSPVGRLSRMFSVQLSSCQGDPVCPLSRCPVARLSICLVVQLPNVHLSSCQGDPECLLSRYSVVQLSRGLYHKTYYGGNLRFP